MPSQKKILITGGAGFIGSNFARYMLDAYPDYRIVVLDALTYAGSVTNLPDEAVNAPDSRLSFIYGDVGNASLVDHIVREVDWVVHFAAETNVTRSIYDMLPFLETDIIGTQVLCNAILNAKDKVERFIYISTSEVYGTAHGELMNEEHALNPASPYAAAKCGADRLVYSLWNTFDLPTIIVRPFNNYGPYQHLEKLMPRMITSNLLGEPLRVHGDGSAARDYVHVHDTCRALDLILHHPSTDLIGEVLNVATGRHRSVLEITQDICTHMGLGMDKIEFVGNRPGQVTRHTGDARKIKSLLGWEPVMTWDEGVEQMIAWYKSHEPWWSPQLWLRTVPIRTASGEIEYH